MYTTNILYDKPSTIFCDKWDDSTGNFVFKILISLGFGFWFQGSFTQMNFQCYWCMVGVIMFLAILLSRKTHAKTKFYPICGLNTEMHGQVSLYPKENLESSLITKLIWYKFVSWYKLTTYSLIMHVSKSDKVREGRQINPAGWFSLGRASTRVFLWRITEPCQSSNVRLFAKTVNGWKLLTIFTKSSILNAWQVSDHTLWIIY